MDAMERSNLYRFIASVSIGLILIGVAFFNPFHIGILERLILSFIGLTIMIMF